MDNRNNVGSPDISRINTGEEYELRYWMKEFGVSVDELKRAVQKVGTSVVDVCLYLKGNPSRQR